jgi:hypothetical protein
LEMMVVTSKSSSSSEPPSDSSCSILTTSPNGKIRLVLYVDTITRGSTKRSPDVMYVPTRFEIMCVSYAV